MSIVVNTAEASEAVKESLSSIAADVARELGLSTTDVKNSLVQMAGETDSSFDSVVQGISAQFGILESNVRAVMGNLRDELASLQTAINSARAAASAPPGKAQGGPVFAGGGSVHGPGTSTSDSIAAFLSAGEYVVKAACRPKVPGRNSST